MGQPRAPRLTLNGVGGGGAGACAGVGGGVLRSAGHVALQASSGGAGACARVGGGVLRSARHVALQAGSGGAGVRGGVLGGAGDVALQASSAGCTIACTAKNWEKTAEGVRRHPPRFLGSAAAVPAGDAGDGSRHSSSPPCLFQGPSLLELRLAGGQAAGAGVGS